MELNLYIYNKADKKIGPADVKELFSHLKELDIEFSLNSSTQIKIEILEVFRLLGWSSKIKVSSEHNISITAIQHSVGLSIQLGNICRFYADLLKLETLYKNKKIKAAYYILPMKAASRRMGSNVIYYERFIEELLLYKATITVPLYVVGIQQGKK